MAGVSSCRGRAMRFRLPIRGCWVSLGAVERVVRPELLDELSFDDPEAIRSRDDIGRINWLMGNHRWFRRALGRLGNGPVIEIGSGNGRLLSILHGLGREVLGVDLTPRPGGLSTGIGWVQGDAREALGRLLAGGEMVIANHLLHQFQDEELAELGEVLAEAGGVLACEPLRARRARWGLRLLSPICNRVTLHDGLVSIEAGFQRGELPRLLGLDPGSWHISEDITLRGAYRLVARRKASGAPAVP